MRVRWKMRQQREGIPNMQNLGITALDDPREVHPLIGQEEKIKIRIQLIGLNGIQRQAGFLCEGVPEFLGHGMRITHRECS
jgi:hypothetical protein